MNDGRQAAGGGRKENPYGKNPYGKTRGRYRRSALNPEDLPEKRDLGALSINSGRMLAWAALQEEGRPEFLQDRMRLLDPQADLSSADRAMAVDIASHIIRRRTTIDRILSTLLTRPLENVEGELLDVLRIGVAQIVFIEVAEHAAVHETVELCRALSRPQWTGLVNGVLRNLIRHLTALFSEQPSARAIPLNQGRFRLWSTPLFTDPADDPTAYFSEAYSLPHSLVTRWAKRMTAEQLAAACRHSIEVPPLTGRVNRSKTTLDDVLTELRRAGIEAVPGDRPGAIRLASGGRVDQLPGFREGHWSVQDESAMLAVEMLRPRAGERLLDLCAAPGGKSCQMAEATQDSAVIIACDVAESRLDRIRENAGRLGLEGIRTELVDRDLTRVPPGPFDGALVDVPCSNTGVLSRRPEARHRFGRDDYQELLRLQTRLLLAACERVRPGGRVVYSTCSIEPEENEMIAKAVAKALPGWRLEECFTEWPDQADGAFRALLVREGVN